MHALKLIAGLAALGAVAVPAFGSIPVSVRLVVVSDDAYGRALNRAYGELLSEGGNFLIAEDVPGGPIIYPDKLAACTAKAADMAACARAEIPAHEINRDYPPVAVLATREKGSVYRWRCVGAAGEDYWPERQTVTIDLSKAMFGTPEERAALRGKALDCIFAAGTEAGGRIKISRD